MRKELARHNGRVQAGASVGSVGLSHDGKRRKAMADSVSSAKGQRKMQNGSGLFRCFHFVFRTDVTPVG